MATNYPTSIDAFTNPAGTATLASPDHAGQHTDINDAVEAIETELGTLPKGSKASVKARLDDVDTSVNLLVPAVPYITGNFYSYPSSGQFGTGTVTVNTTLYFPFYVTENKTFDRIAIVSGSTFSGSGTVRLGIYNNSGFQPSTVLLDAGTVAVSAADTGYTITISQALSVGWYWLAFNSTVAAATNTFRNKFAMGFQPYNLGTLALQSNAYVGYNQSVNATSGFATAASLGFFFQGPAIALRST